jgi:Uma2 family endonuclease
MSVVAEPLVTAEEFVLRHGHDSGVELVNGRIMRIPMPGAKHGFVTSTVDRLVGAYVTEHQLGRVFGNDTFVRVRSKPDTYRGPDVCFVSYAKLSKESEVPDGPLEIPPDLVVEVRSPSDSSREMRDKAREYLDSGVRVVVVVEPQTESVWVDRNVDWPQGYHNGDVLTIPDVLPGFAVPVRQFFG